MSKSPSTLHAEQGLADFDPNTARDLLHQMLRIRQFEERCVQLYSAGEIRGFLHLYIGEEAVAAGVMPVLAPDDAIVATYREHGHALVRGVPMAAVMAEMFGKVEGCSGGRGGSMHLFDASTRFYGGHAIVGGGLPVAVGLALAERMQETGRIVALYRVPEGLSQRSFHQIIWTALEKTGDYPKEVVPFSIRENLNLGNLSYALKNIHFPVSFVDLKKAREYLIFEEFFLLTAAMLKHRMQTALLVAKKNVVKVDSLPNFINRFQNLLPFSLSESQQTALGEIITDLQQPFPMQRLLTGEVGSGKTAVAAGAIFYTILSGGQAALLAPTEILAEQHFLTFQRIFAQAGYEVALLVNDVAKKDKDRIKKELVSGKISLVIGTHSLLSKELNFTDLSLAVIDEEHKFGVNQRDLLGEKGKGVHVLLMSATPIPRTLALTLYGGLSLSSLSERGQRKVATYLFQKDEREVAYRLFDTLLQQGKTGYIVTSRLKKNEDLVGARPLFEEISGRFPHWNPALIYGGLSLPEKEKAIAGFSGGKHKVLVATSVVEVGLDLPEANLLMVEDAERFGLSQLHQMRGRIGRKFQDALCLVIGDLESGVGGERLNLFASIDQGQQLAEDDLVLRGEGEVLGERQHGLPPLRIANLRRDLKLLQIARDSAQEILSKDPSLASHPELSLRLQMQDIQKNKT